MKTWNAQPVLNGDQVRKIEMALAQSRGGQGFTEDEFIQAVSQCEKVILACQALTGVFSGFNGIDLQNGKIVFYARGKG